VAFKYGIFRFGPSTRAGNHTRRLLVDDFAAVLDSLLRITFFMMLIVLMGIVVGDVNGGLRMLMLYLMQEGLLINYRGW